METGRTASGHRFGTMRLKDESSTHGGSKWSVDKTQNLPESSSSREITSNESLATTSSKISASDRTGNHRRGPRSNRSRSTSAASLFSLSDEEDKDVGDGDEDAGEVLQGDGDVDYIPRTQHVENDDDAIDDDADSEGRVASSRPRDDDEEEVVEGRQREDVYEPGKGDLFGERMDPEVADEEIDNDEDDDDDFDNTNHHGNNTNHHNNNTNHHNNNTGSSLLDSPLHDVPSPIFSSESVSLGNASPFSTPPPHVDPPFVEAPTPDSDASAIVRAAGVAVVDCRDTEPTSGILFADAGDDGLFPDEATSTYATAEPREHSTPSSKAGVGQCSRNLFSTSSCSDSDDEDLFAAERENKTSAPRTDRVSKTASPELPSKPDQRESEESKQRQQQRDKDLLVGDRKTNLFQQTDEDEDIFTREGGTETTHIEDKIANKSKSIFDDDEADVDIFAPKKEVLEDKSNLKGFICSINNNS